MWTWNFKYTYRNACPNVFRIFLLLLTELHGYCKPRVDFTQKALGMFTVNYGFQRIGLRRSSKVDCLLHFGFLDLIGGFGWFLTILKQKYSSKPDRIALFFFSFPFSALEAWKVLLKSSDQTACPNSGTNCSESSHFLLEMWTRIGRYWCHLILFVLACLHMLSLLVGLDLPVAFPYQTKDCVCLWGLNLLDDVFLPLALFKTLFYFLFGFLKNG